MPIEIFDRARNSYGTDEDLIFVFSKDCENSASIDGSA